MKQVLEVVRNTDEAQEFYKYALEKLNNAGFSYMIGGAFALFKHTGIYRDTKDLDIFCKAGDYIKMLKLFAEDGFRTEITDARWIAKAFKEEYFIDFIFNTPNSVCAVDDTWIKNATPGEHSGVPTLFLPAEELFWCKIYVQNRDRFDGADVNHILLKKGKELDWKRILMRMDQHWHLLFAQLLNFQFVYPSERDNIPRWVIDELMNRTKEQYDLPASIEKVCRGPLIEHTHYNMDITEWEYKIITCKRL